MSTNDSPNYAALLQRAMTAIEQLEARLAASEGALAEPIAIVGIGCRFPGGADSPEKFWDLLHDGVDAVTEVPAWRWDLAKVYDPDPDTPGKSYARWGAFIPDVDQFDAAFFGISPREAVSLDPQQRMLLEVTWEALEHAGIAPSSLAGCQGAVYVGITTFDYAMELAETRSGRLADAYTAAGTAHSIAAGRLSYMLGLHGPNVAIDTACSSSLVALHWAVQSLRLGEADIALAGGVNLTLSPAGSILLSRARMMSFTGRCRSFDAGADGYVRGEGGAMLVLKRLSDARRDGDRILALVRGSALNQDGRSSGLTAPNGRAQERVIRAALANARLEPGAIDYVEAHGTGTALGDPIEVGAISQVFGSRPGGQPLLIGSVKANIGHLEAAAGIAGVVKCVLAMQHRCIPAHLHFREPNPLIPWDESSIQVSTSATEWVARPGAPRRAGVSSFGFSGTNAHLILEEAPQPAALPPAHGPRLLVLSAQSPEALRQLATRCADVLEAPSPPVWADVTATAAMGRSHFEERLAIVAENGPGAAATLRSIAQGEVPPGAARGRVVGGSPEPVFMFTGQGAQYPGMARRLFDAEPVFHDALAECDRLLAPLLPRPLLEVMFAEDEEAAALLGDTAYTQPALFAVEYALAQLWRSWGIEPGVMLGHSVGEYVAACIAGVFSLADGLRLIAERGRLMGSLPRDGAMAAVFAGEARVRDLVRAHPGVTIATINGPQNTVVSGLRAGVEAVVQQAVREGLEAQLLKVSHAFHSPLMEPILDQFERVAATVHFMQPSIGVVSNVTGHLAGPEICTPGYWRTHLRQAVRFGDSIEFLYREGHRTFLEVGPASTLIGMAQHLAPAGDVRWVPSLRKGREDRTSMLEALGQLYCAGAVVQWGAILGAEAASRRATLPSYPYQRSRYWHPLETAGGRQALRQLRAPHPLLAGRLDSAQSIYQGELVLADTPWLADHQIFDFLLFPATGYLELAAAAAGDALDGAPVELQDLSIAEPLRLHPGDATTVQVSLSPSGEGALAVQLFARKAADSDAPWRLHATMSARRSTAPPRQFDLAARRAALTEFMDVAAYYERLARQGAAYGPAFRGIRSIQRTGQEALGEISVDGEVVAGAPEMLLHPALLDAAFQLIGVVLPGDEICVPVGLSQYRVHRQGTMGAWCHVAVSPQGSDGKGFTADITLLAVDGSVIAEARGLALRRTPRSVLQRAIADGAMQDWAWEVEWRPVPASAGTAATPPGRWIVFADATGLGDAVARELEAGGDGVVRVRAGAAAEGDAAGHLDPADPAQFRALLARAAGRDARPLKGIVYLWPLDAARRDGAGINDIVEGQRRSLTAALHLAQALGESDARLWVVTRGTQAVAGSIPELAQSPLWGLAGVIETELPTVSCTRIDLDPASDAAESRHLAEGVRHPDQERRVAWRAGTRYVARLVASSTVPADEASRCLEIDERGTLANLQLRPVPRQSPGPGEVEIRVHATGLNFRDVLNALGMYPGDPGPLGNECSGVVSAVGPGVTAFSPGDEVIAMVDRSFATWVIAPEALTVRKPAGLTHPEAATIPVTFLTAQYALHDLAGIRKGDRVLVHAITGGVGMAALQLALRAGAEVYGTAGTPEKRSLALSLGAQFVADSRSPSFEEDIRRATGGKGVDIVLNSLAGDFIPASLRLLRPGGRFVEIGKTAIWDESRVAREFPGVHYHALYLGDVTASDPARMRAMLDALLADMASGALRPLPHRTWPIERAEEAFRYMGQGQHTGKLVIVQYPGADVRPGASYLVTGGLGGLGLLCARHLAEAGARHLVLMGRRSPSPVAQQVIDDLRARGTTVVVEQADVADRDAVASILGRIDPPLRGILHAAGSVDDGMLPELHPSRFDQVMAPKVQGTWNLHELTRKLSLDFFVLFSSGAALLGSPGQGNYAAANTFMDALAHRRRARGLPATSINWGSWSDVGMAAALDERYQRRWASLGLGMISPDDGVRMLQALLAANHGAQVAALPLVLSRLPQDVGAFLSDLVARRRPAQGTGEARAGSGGDDVLARLGAAGDGERPAILAAFLSQQVVKVLALPPSQVDAQGSLMDLGIGSLMAMELRNRIQSALNVRLAVADLLKGPSINVLTKELLGALGTAGATADAGPAFEEGSL